MTAQWRAVTSNWKAREQHNHSTSLSRPYQLTHSLNGLTRYRAALDAVRHDIPNQRLPLPSDFGLDLPAPTSAQISWGRR